MISKRLTELFRWLLLAGLLCCSSCQNVPTSLENKPGGQNDSRPRIFSPRMDYDEWTPLGRGDPLKNNPTFDYVPPVLDKVQYWLDSQQHTTEPSSKRDILVLGVTAKKISPKIPEQFLKFVDGPKFTRTGSQDSISYRNDFTGSTGAEPPKIVRTTNFRNGLIDYRNQNRLQSLPASYYSSSYYSQKIKPYTMMMPPPMIQKAETSTSFNAGTSKDKILGYPDTSSSFSTQTEEGPVLQDTQYYGTPSKDYGRYSPVSSSRPYSSKAPPSKVETIKSVYLPSTSQNTKSRYEATTAPSVSFEKSNLIYQSTQTLSGGWLGNNGPTSSSTVFPLDINQVTWQTSDYSKDHYDHHAAASSNQEVVISQNANIIVDASKNENEEVVIGQKEISTEATSSTTESVAQTSTASTTTTDSTEQEEETTTDVQSSQKMHIVVANSPFSTIDLETHKAKKGSVAVVIPTNYIEKNFSASSSDLPMHNIAWENLTTSEITKTTHQVPKSQSQPIRNAITNSPILSENYPSASSVPMRMILPSQHQPLHPPSAPVMPPRHIDSSSNMYVSPQAAQSMMRPQIRPNTMIHFIGSMRPSFRPSSSVSMSHMSPPMTHLHAPSMNNMMVPLPSMEQTHQRLPQPFPVTFTNPPSPSTFSTQIPESNEQLIDHRPSRLPATTVTTSPSFTSTISTMEYTPTMDTMDQHENTKPNQSPLIKILNVEETSKMKTMLTPSSMIPPRTTTVPSLTTDPIFSHYKQPSKPIRGPMYLIIQGHSKVKTYKPTVNKHGVPVENNEIMESATERQLSKLEQLIRENTKNGAVDLAAEKRKLEEKARAEKHVSSRKETLMSLVESGLNGFTVPSSTVAEDERRMSNSVTSIEIN
ncbi:PREDICTED: flocculation protein FLO11 [Acromyrmex echinatior]|uniref:flocculation protein FLO11 n=1 Tax=Acromyrmex echinatior TaxID=103372 RepID=UPI000580E4BA|nr:PREDICTED: flocculation protein FLO11 [Acromyrmex echinatior]XP_011064611.1 PREDICTED: flocculation protein FLO11 [Acromyrmex echinatior]